MQLKNKPKLLEIKEAIDSFDENNLNALEKLILKKYNLTKNDISPLELRITNAFVKNEANIFSNKFVRVLNNEEFDVVILNEVEKRAERMFHLLGRAGVLVSLGDGDPLLDDVESPNFTVVTPLDYWHEENYWIYDDIDGVYIFETVSDINQKIVKTYKSTDSYDNVLEQFDNEKVGFGCNAEEDLTFSSYEYVPIVEWKKENVDNITINPVVRLELHFIKQLTWGLHNADPKLLNQTILKSEAKIEEVKNKLANYGKTSKIIQLGIGDTLEIFSVGDISVLKDLFVIRSMAVEELALTRGVDVSAVIRSTQPISGEAKKMDLGYINRIRNDYKIPARNFDKRIFNLLKANYGINCGWESFVVCDIELVADKLLEKDYAIAMRTGGFWTNAEAVSHVRQVTPEEAEEFIKANGLEPDIGQIS